MSGGSDTTKAFSPTAAKTNFLRLCRLLITGGTRVSRQILDKIHPPATLATVLATPAIEAELKKLPKTSRDIIYPAPGTYGKSEDFDITILSRLLRVACNLAAPATGWNDEPPQADHSISADLVRIRRRRNEIHAHVGEKMEIEDKTFNAAWFELRGILIRLANFVSADNAKELEKTIDDLLKAPLTEEEEISAKELEQWYLQDISTKKKLENMEENLGNKIDEVLSGQKTIMNKIMELNHQTPPKVPKQPPAQLRDESPRLGDLQPDVNIKMESSGATSGGAKLTLREYQKELARDALQGKNCIICAPTGSGKTIVALYIALQCLKEEDGKEFSEDSEASAKKRGKVLFVVDRIHLTTQQQKRFQTFLPKEYRAASISSDNSDDSVTLENLLDNNDVVVSTAQIVVEALKNGVIKLTDLFLLIIDECHHTDGEHPYNKIMSHYLSLKLQPAKSTTLQLPQVVGLSASLGVGKAKTVSAAAEHIIHMCSTMDAQTLSTVKHNEEELREFVSTPEVTLHKVTKTDYDMFEVAVNNVMSRIEEQVVKFRNVQRFNGNDRAQQPYRNWIEDTRVAAFGNRYLITYLEHLQEYHVALTIAEVSRMTDAISYLQRFFGKHNESKYTDEDRKLKGLFDGMRKDIESFVQEHGEPANPKLKKVEELITGYHMEDENVRGILFTKTRESTLALESWMKETKGLKEKLSAARIIGTGSGEASLTASERQQAIRDFEKGDVNILIATTVAEEGLDLAACSYVIRLDMPGNEISTEQARGRVRTQRGRYDVISGDSTGLVEKEMINLKKAVLMKKGVEYVKNMNDEEFMKKVSANQQKQIQQRAIKSHQLRLTRSQFQPEDVTFYCKKCGKMVCQAHDFRLLRDTYYVVITEDFKERITIKPHHKPWKKDVEVNQKVHCVECEMDWGVNVTADGVTLPSLKIKSFVLKMSDGTQMHVSQWKKVPFVVPPADFSDFFPCI